MEEMSEDSYMALHISKGRFVFSLGSGGTQIKLKTSIKYNDGQWHTVSMSQEPWWNHNYYSAGTACWIFKVSEIGF